MKWAFSSARWPAAVAALLLLAACGTSREPPTSASPVVGHYKLGRPYQINGRWYYPEYDPSYSRVGIASWYGDAFHGLPTANGEVFDKNLITAAHPTLPLPSLVRVTNLENGRSLELRVNDRGPFIGDRLIDLSEAAAKQLGYDAQGLAKVKVEFVRLADARGTPPAPTVAARTPAPPRVQTASAAPAVPAVRGRPAARPAAALPAAPPVAPPADERVQLASLEVAPAAASCGTGERFIQVGAFAETERVRAVQAALAGFEPLRVEPAFVGGKAVARVRLGPLAAGTSTRALLDRVHAMGYTGAYVTTVAGAVEQGTLTC